MSNETRIGFISQNSLLILLQRFYLWNMDRKASADLFCFAVQETNKVTLLLNAHWKCSFQGLKPQNQKKKKKSKNDYKELLDNMPNEKGHRFPSFSSCLFIESLQLCAISFRNERRDDRRLRLLAGSCNPVSTQQYVISHFPCLRLIALFLQQTLKRSNFANFQIS